MNKHHFASVLIVTLGLLFSGYSETTSLSKFSFIRLDVRDLCQNNKYNAALSLLNQSEKDIYGITDELEYRFEFYNSIIYFPKQYRQNDFFIKQKELLLPMADENKNKAIPDRLYVNIARFLYCTGHRQEAITMMARLDELPAIPPFKIGSIHGPRYLVNTNFYLDIFLYETNAGDVWGAYYVLYHAKRAGETFVKLKTCQSVPIDIILKYPFTLSAWLVLTVEALLMVLPFWAILRYLRYKINRRPKQMPSPESTTDSLQKRL